MDKMIIGENAGKIWQAMKNIEEISIPELAGWLARENKICIRQKNGVIKLFNENYYAFRY